MCIDLILQLHRTTHRVGLFLESWKPPLQVSQAEAHILAFLVQAGACPVGAVHAAFGHKRSTLTGVLDRLEGRGWIAREANPADRRSLLVRLTPNGAGQAEQVRAALAALGRELAGRVAPELLEQTLQGLEALDRAAQAAASPD